MKQRTVMGMMGAGLMGLLAVTPAAAESVEQRLERMEREIKDLKGELRARDERDRARAAEPAPKPTAQVAEPAPTPPATATVATPPKSLADRVLPSAVTDRVKLGGYGSLRYEGNSLKDMHHTFTLRRFVLTADGNIASRLRGYMELEFERFRELELEKKVEREDGGLGFEQAIEGSEQSAIEMEQAWLEFKLADWARFRAGEVLVPIGRFNINHDDNQWNLPRRSLVDRGTSVLPVKAAWSELGLGFVGDHPVGREGQLAYQLFVMNGATLDFEFEQKLATRFPESTLNVIEGKLHPQGGTFGNDVKDAKAVAGRLAWSPRLGHEIAGSAYWGQYTPDFLSSEDLWSLALDGRTGWGPFELEGQYVFTRYEGIGSVARTLARVAGNSASSFENADVQTDVEFNLEELARNKQGYWLEGRYRFWPAFLTDTILGRDFDNPQFVAVMRAEQVWLGGLIKEVQFTGGKLTGFDTENRRVDRITAGLAYRPVPQVAFQLAYEFTQTNSGKSLSEVTNYLVAQEHEDHAHAILLGATFGF